MKYVTVKADTNDGDYVEETTNIDQYIKYYDLDLVEVVKKTAKIIKENPDGHNWTSGEMYDEASMSYYKELLTPKEFEFFESLVPSGEYGIHSIESITILEVLTDERLL